MKHLILVLVFLVIIASCNEKKAENITEYMISFDKSFFGNIDSIRGIYMNLTVNENVIRGDFFDTSNAFIFKVDGEFFGDSTFYLREFDSCGNQTGLFKGKMSSNQTLSGIWMKPDSSQKSPFVLLISDIDGDSLLNAIAIRYQNDMAKQFKPETKKQEATGTPKIKSGINELIKLGQSYKEDGKQGVKSVLITLENISKFDFDKIKVKVDYYKSNGVQVKTTDLTLVGLTKNKIEKITAPDDKKANYIVARIVEAESSEAKYYFNHYSQLFNK